MNSAPSVKNASWALMLNLDKPCQRNSPLLVQVLKLCSNRNEQALFNSEDWSRFTVPESASMHAHIALSQQVRLQ